MPLLPTIVATALRGILFGACIGHVTCLLAIKAFVGDTTVVGCVIRIAAFEAAISSSSHVY